MINSPETEAEFSGHLIVFVGSSGSGKDTLMVKARDFLDLNCHIVQRWITRENDETEGFRSTTVEEFKEAIKENIFALYWEIYGNYYGVPKSEINPFLENGIVLLNLSRSLLPKLKELYPKALIVLVEVSNDIAEERIRKRKRDQGEMLDARLKRLHEDIDLGLIPDLVIKNNSRTISATISVLLEFLRASYY